MIHFYKYQGTGNDFIIVDNRNLSFLVDEKYIERLCDRRFGIGADGLILLQNDVDSDFRMVYFNSDGKESSMCGNGGRCIVSFAKKLKIIDDATIFVAIDGMHEATIDNDIVSLKMGDVISVGNYEKSYYMDTGSPHYVSFVDDVSSFPLVEEAHKIRYNEQFIHDGTNVNFVTVKNSGIQVRTYERGVEDETLSCGTGVTACAIASYLKFGNKTNWNIDVEGGELSVRFDTLGKGFNNIWLTGPATFVFKGEIN